MSIVLQPYDTAITFEGVLVMLNNHSTKFNAYYYGYYG
jgi:hypothetical protein